MSVTGIVLDVGTDLLALIVVALSSRNSARMTPAQRLVCAATVFGLFLCGRDFRRDEHLLDMLFTGSFTVILLWQAAITLRATRRPTRSIDDLPRGPASA